MTRKPRSPRTKSVKTVAEPSRPLFPRLRLFVARPTPSSTRAESNLAAALALSEYGAAFEVEIVDVLQNPHQAVKDRIIVTPCILVVGSHPPLTIVGDLSDTSAVLRFLEQAKNYVTAG